MKNLLAVVLLVCWLVGQPFQALASSTTGPTIPPNKRVDLGNGCFGATHDPHPSSHYPKTINVTSETHCKGNRVSVETFMYQGDNPKSWKLIKRGSVFKFENAVAQTNVPCLPGKIYRITAISLHAGEWGKIARTENSATVLCMTNIRPSPATTSKK